LVLLGARVTILSNFIIREVDVVRRDMQSWIRLREGMDVPEYFYGVGKRRMMTPWALTTRRCRPADCRHADYQACLPSGFSQAQCRVPPTDGRPVPIAIG